MPSIALSAMRAKSHAGISAKSAARSGMAASSAPSATETRQANTVTWFAVMPDR